MLAGPLNADGSRARGTRRDQFDDLVAGLADRLIDRWGAELGEVEFGAEDVPVIPPDWDEPVPLGALTRPEPGRPGRIVVFRRPVEVRAKAGEERAALVNEVLVEHVAELLGRDADEIDP